MGDKFLSNWRYFLVILVPLIINLFVLDFWVIGERNEKLKIKNKQSLISGENEKIEQELPRGEDLISPFLLPPVVVTPSDNCGSVCKKEIARRVAEAIATISGQKMVETKTVVKEVVPALASEQAKVIYIPLVASAANSKTDWTDVTPSEFYFDLTSYPGAKTVRFNGFLRAVHATGPVYARLYDVTNKRGVDNSDFSTSSDSFQRFESAPLSIWRGNNLYRLQLKSPNGTEALLSEAKLKVEW